jgi:hypothetical protein
MDYCVLRNISHQAPNRSTTARIKIIIHMTFLGMLLDIHLLFAELLRKFLIRFRG